MSTRHCGPGTKHRGQGNHCSSVVFFSPLIFPLFLSFFLYLFLSKFMSFLLPLRSGPRTFLPTPLTVFFFVSLMITMITIVLQVAQPIGCRAPLTEIVRPSGCSSYDPAVDARDLTVGPCTVIGVINVHSVEQIGISFMSLRVSCCARPVVFAEMRCLWFQGFLGCEKCCSSHPPWL